MDPLDLEEPKEFAQDVGQDVNLLDEQYAELCDGGLIDAYEDVATPAVLWKQYRGEYRVLSNLTLAELSQLGGTCRDALSVTRQYARDISAMARDDLPLEALTPSIQQSLLRSAEAFTGEGRERALQIARSYQLHTHAVCFSTGLKPHAFAVSHFSFLNDPGRLNERVVQCNVTESWAQHDGTGRRMRLSLGVVGFEDRLAYCDLALPPHDEGSLLLLPSSAHRLSPDLVALQAKLGMASLGRSAPPGSKNRTAPFGGFPVSQRLGAALPRDGLYNAAAGEGAAAYSFPAEGASAEADGPELSEAVARDMLGRKLLPYALSLWSQWVRGFTEPQPFVRVGARV